MHITHSDVSDLLRDIFGAQAASAEVNIVRQLPDYLVATAKITNPEHQVIIKLAGPAAPRPSLFNRTAALLKLVAEKTQVPVPEVIAVDETLLKWPWRWLITTSVPGRLWADISGRLPPGEKKRAYAQIGEAAAGLHDISFPAPGELDERLHGQANNSYPDALRARARSFIKAPAMRDYFLHVIDRFAGLLDAPFSPGLCHEDLHGYNLLFNQEQGHLKLAAVLDFDKAWSANTESDLARMSLWKMDGEGFWPAYTACRKLDALYTLRRPIFQLFWCLEYADPGPKHLADTRAVCRQLGMPAIESLEPFIVSSAG